MIPMIRTSHTAVPAHLDRPYTPGTGTTTPSDTDVMGTFQHTGEDITGTLTMNTKRGRNYDHDLNGR